jgi:urease accessory protein
LETDDRSVAAPTHASDASRAGPRAGEGRLHVARTGDRSVVRCAYATSPLKLLQPKNAGHAAWVYASTYGGGLVDGDAISLDIDVDVDATAFVSTQASTKVYRSPAGTANRVTARVGEGALLVMAPDPLVCFAGASCRQSQTYELSAGASLVCVDWITSGRRAFGERWQFDKYEGHVAVRQGGRAIVYDALVLTQADGDLAVRLGRFNALAFIVIAGPRLASHAAAIVSVVAGRPVVRGADLIVAASAVGEDACVIRLAGVSVEEVGRAIRQWLSFLPRALGDDPWTRKW